ncbi:MAG: ABC transporter permease subunit, partial [Lachnospiraceae bacterium]|nr:ABC transporter permease subunit [Lachnospiraceae bacterium]
LGIDDSLFEAASIDGCSEVKKVWYITLPHLKTTIITLTLLSLGGILTSDFGLFYYVPRNSGTLYPVTDVLTTYVNRAIRSGGSLNNASAVSFFTSIVGFVLVVTTNLMVKKIDPNSSLF